MANTSGCNETFSGNEDQVSVIGKTILLGTLMLCTVVGNVTLFVYLNRTGKGQTRIAFTWLQKALCVTGILFSLHNVTVHIVTTVKGGWILSNIYCQAYGLTFHVFIGTWAWLLTLAALERYTKQLLPGEHPALFSPINTKIQASGLLMLMVVVFLAPTYGWGEYSQFRGELSCQLRPNAAVDLTGHTVSQESVQQQVYAYLASPQYVEGSQAFSMRTYQFFHDLREFHIRQLYVLPEGVIMSIRAPHWSHVECLQQQHINGHLGREITQYLVSSEMLRDLELSNVSFQVVINNEQVETYKKTHLNYQDAAMCGLDYSKVNRHIDSFVAFMLIVTVMLPFLTVFYFYGRIALSFLRNTKRAIPVTMKPDDDVTFVVILLTSLLTLMIYVTYFAVNISAGREHDITQSVHFACITLLNCTPLTLCLAHAQIRLFKRLPGVKCHSFNRTVVRPVANGENDKHEVANLTCMESSQQIPSSVSVQTTSSAC